MKKIIFGAALSFLIAFSVFSQDILTAQAFFQGVSQFYGTIKDYEASLDITAGKVKMDGKVSFLRPNLLRIDFANPEEQVITFNGDMLTIYLPGSQAILNQSVDPATKNPEQGQNQPQSKNQNPANLATPQGLALMNRYYSIAYEIGQTPVPLDEGSDEKVVKLVLSRKSNSEAFRNLKIAVTPETNLIRRIEAITPQEDSFIFDFSNYVINSGISDQRFIYDPPSSANNYNNFLFSE